MSVSGAANAEVNQSASVKSATASAVMCVNPAALQFRKTKYGGTATAQSFSFTNPVNLGATPAAISATTDGTPGSYSAAVSSVTQGVDVSVDETLLTGSGTTKGLGPTALTCTDTNANLSGNPSAADAIVGSVSGNKLTIPATAIRTFAMLQCTVTNRAATVRFAKMKVTGDATATTASFSANTNLTANPANITSATADSTPGSFNAAVGALDLTKAVSVTESPAAGFKLTGASCTDTSAAISGNPAGTGAIVPTITSAGVITVPAQFIKAGATLDCILTNTRSVVQVSKRTIAASGTSTFSFTKTNLDAIPAAITVTGSATASSSSGPIRVTNTASAVTLSETPVVGWSTTYSCVDLNAAITSYAPISGNNVTNTVTIPAASLPGANWSCKFTNTALAPSLSLLKTVSSIADTNSSGRVDAGDTVNYTLALTNNGSYPLTNIAVTDPLATVSGSPVTALAVGATVNLTATHQLSQSDMNLGSFTNSATASTTYAGNTVSDVSDSGDENTDGPDPDTDPTNDPTVVPLTAAPGLKVVKSATVVDSNNNGLTDAGDIINYSFTITNTGNVTINGITLADTRATISGGTITKLDPGGVDSTTFTGSHVLTQAEVNSGTYVNQATASGTTAGGAPITAQSTATSNPGTPGPTTVTIPPVARLVLVKSVKRVDDLNTNGKTDTGDRINYRFVTSNTGNVTLSNVTITDSLSGLSTLSCVPLQPATLLPGNSLTCDATYAITSGDVNAGKVDNSARADGTDPSGAAATPGFGSTRTLLDPIGVNDAATTGHDTAVNIAVLNNDFGPGLTVSVLGPPSHGTVVRNADNTVTYTPSPGFSGQDTFIYNAVTSDGNVYTATVTVDVTPQGADNTATTGQGRAVQIPVLANDIGAGLTVTSTTAAPNGTVTVNADGSITYTPNPGYIGDDTFTYTVTDGGGHAYTQVVTVHVLPAPSMKVTKTVTGTSDNNNNNMIDAGDDVLYAFRVENTGAFALTGITLTDTKATVQGGPIATLAIGAVDDTTFTAKHRLTQAEVNTGYVDNSATASAGSSAGTVSDVSDADDETVDGPDADSDPTNDPTRFVIPVQGGFTAVKAIGSVTDTNGNNKTDAGDVVHYTFAVTNNTNIDLDIVTIHENDAVAAGGPINALPPGATDTTTFSATHTLTQADVDAGSYSNQAKFTAVKPGGGVLTVPTSTPGDPTKPVDPDTNPVGPGATVLPITPDGSVSVVKSVSSITDTNGNSKTDAGDVINYAFAVTNTGTVTLHDVAVTDTKATVVAAGPGTTIATLAPGTVDDTFFTASHTLTQADVDAGSFANRAVAEGLTPKDVTVTADSSTPTDPTKPVSPTNPVVAGDTVVPADAVGSVSVVKSVSSVADNNDNSKTDVGDVINYAFAVTNTGTVTLHDVKVTDTKASIVAAGPGTVIATLLPGATDTSFFSAAHTVTQADVDAGSFANRAVAEGLTPKDVKVTADSSTPTDPTKPVSPTNPLIAQDTVVGTDSVSSLSVLKSISSVADTNNNSVTDAGDVIHYAFTVTNSGTVTLHDVKVTDANATVAAAGPGTVIASLAPGESNDSFFTASHALTQAEVDAGSFTNRAVGEGLTPKDVKVTADSSTPQDPTQPVSPTNPVEPQATVATIDPLGSVSVVKSIASVTDTNGNSTTDAGDVIHYAFAVTNTGNVTLHDVKVTDAKASVAAAGPGTTIATLAPGATNTTFFTATHVLTQTEVDSGSFANRAVAEGLTPKDVKVTADSSTPTDPTQPVSPSNPLIADDTVLPITPSGSVAVAKSVSSVTDTNNNNVTDAGDVIHYAFAVTNTGTVTLHDVTVTDAKATVAAAGPGTTIATLLPGASDTTFFTATHTLTQADVDAGSFNNRAKAEGLTPKDAAVSADSSSSDDPTQPVGPGNPLKPQDAVLAVGPAGSVDVVKSISSVTDTNGNSTTDAGDVIHYAFAVTNTGNVTLHDVKVADAKASVAAAGPGTTIATLAPGATNTTFFTASHVLTQTEVDSGSFANRAVAEGLTPKDVKVTADSSTPTDPTQPVDPDTNPVVPGDTVLPVTPNGSVEVVKSVQSVTDTNNNNVTDAGDVIHYAFAVTNTGNVTLHDVKVTDTKATVVAAGPGTTIATLAPGATNTTFFTASHALTQDDVDAGSFANRAVGEGLTPKDVKVTADSSTPTDPTKPVEPDTNPVVPGDTVLPVTPNGSVAVVKSVQSVTDTNNNNVTDAGDVIHYAFAVTNTGTVTLHDVKVTDTKATVAAAGPGTTIATLLPGATDTTFFTASHTLTQDDVDAGSFANRAVAEGLTPKDVKVTADSSTPTDPTKPVDPDTNPLVPGDTVVPVGPSGSIDVVKSIASVTDTNNNTVTDAGDVIHYAFAVTNTGNVTLHDVKVTDTKATVVAAGPGTTIATLLPGATDTTFFAASHVLTQAEVDSGGYANRAVAEGLTPKDVKVTADSSTPTDPTQPVSPTNPLQPTDTVLPVGPVGAVEVVKSIASVTDTNNNTITDAGDVIHYAFAVTNTGNVTLHDVNVTDTKATVVAAGPGTTIATLLPGATDSTFFTASHALTQADVDAGAFANRAVAEGLTPKDVKVTADSSTPTDPTKPVDPDTNPIVPGNTVLPVTPNGSIGVVKSVQSVSDTNNNHVTDAGDVIHYAFAVTNTGNVTLHDVKVTDANATVVAAGPGTTIATLAPGASDSTFFSASHALTQAEVDSGSFANRAVAEGLTPKDVKVTADSSTPTDPTKPVDPDTNPVVPGDTVLPVGPQASLEVVKSISSVTDTNNNKVTDAGDVIHYAFAVTNTGNVTLHDVKVTDAKATVVAAGPGTTIATLAPGATDTTFFTASHTLTQDDVDAGSFANRAVAEGLTPKDVKVTADSSTPTDPTKPVDPDTNPVVPGNTVLPVAPDGSLTVVKSISSVTDTNNNKVTDAGDVIHYAFAVTNTGNVTLHDVTVTDAKATVVAAGPGTAIATLAPGASDSTFFSASHALTQDDVDAGSFANRAVAEGLTPTGVKVTADSSTPTDPTKPVDPDTNPVVPGDTVLPVGPQASIEVVKSISSVTDTNKNNVTDAGDVINYAFAVTNTGSLTLHDVKVTDAKATVVAAGPGTTIATLAPGATDSTFFTASHALTQADVDAGTFANRAVAEGLTPKNVKVIADSSTPTDPTKPVDPDTNPIVPGNTALPVTPDGSVTVVKSISSVTDTNKNNITDAGDVIHYAFAVTNTGNVTLHDVTVTDAKATVVAAGPGTAIATLLPGATDSTFFTASHALTQADVDAGTFANRAVAEGLTPTDVKVTADSSTPTDPTKPVDPDTNPIVPGNTVLPVTPDGSVTVVKSISSVTDTNKNNITDAGDVIHYAFAVTNTGNVTLHDVTVTDTKATVVAAGPGTTIATLLPGATDNTFFTASHALTQDDVDAGTFANQAVGEGLTPKNVKVTADSSTPTDPTKPVDPDTNPVIPGNTVLPVAPDGSLEVVKSISSVTDTNKNNITDAGDVINYAFAVTNTGNVTLHDVTVTDTKATVVAAGPGTTIATLLPGATDNTFFTASHALTQDDVDAGTFANRAKAEGLTPKDVKVTADSSTPTDPTKPVDPDTNPVIPGDTVLPVGPQASIEVVKSIASVTDTNNNKVTDAGDVINYAFTVTNTGSLTLHDVNVTDTKATVKGDPISLVPGASDDSTFTASHTLTQDDVDAGTFANRAVAEGLTPKNVKVTADSSTPTDPTKPVDPDTNPVVPGDTVLPVGPEGSISVVKSISSVTDTNKNNVTDAGDVINYAFTVTNTGTVTLHGVTVTDTKATVTGNAITLAPKAVDDATFTATHTLTQADVDAGRFNNRAVAEGLTPKNVKVTADSSTPTDPTKPVDPDTNPLVPAETSSPIAAAPSIYAVKSVASVTDTNRNGVVDAGDVIHYAFAVTNTGNVTVHDVGLTDGAASVAGGTIGELAPGATDSATFSATHTLTGADIDAGHYDNRATATGLTPADVEVSTLTSTPTDPTKPVDPDTNPVVPRATVLPLAERPGIAVVKSISSVTDTNKNNITDAGDVIRYTFAVTNTGNVTLHGVKVTDTKAVITGDAITLAAGASDTTTFSGEHSLTQDDVDTGRYANRAVAEGLTPTNKTTTADSSTPTDPTKPVSPTNPVTPGETVLPVTEAGALTAVKWVSSVTDTNKNNMTDAGDVVHYAFTVTNTGNVTLTNVTATDAGATLAGGPIASLAPGATDGSTFSATHALAQAEVDAGHYDNQATFEGTTPAKKKVTADTSTPTDPTKPVDPENPVRPGPTVLPIAGNPSMTAVKSISSVTDSNGNGVIDSGDVVHYAFTVTNTGNVTLTVVTLTDVGSDVTGGPIAMLVPKASDSTTYTATHTLKLADVNAGHYDNQAHLVGQTTSSGTTETDTATPTDPQKPVSPTNPAIPGPTVLPIPEKPAVITTKVATAVHDTDNSGTDTEGDVVDFTIVVTNTGNVTLHNFDVTDSLPGVTPLNCTPALTAGVDPLATLRCTTTYAMTAADVAAGKVTNTATATGDTPQGVTSQPHSGTAVAALNPAGNPDTGTTAAGIALNGTTVLGNDTGVGLHVTSYQATSASGSAVVVNPDGTYTYTPKAGFSGVDTFTYTVTDSNGKTYTATVTITVTPRGNDDTAVTTVGTPVPVSVLDNDLGTGLNITATTDGAHGTVAIGDNGTAVYTPEAGFSGTDTFTYTATDARGATFTRTVTVTVKPVGADDATATAVNTPVSLDVLGNDQGSGLLVRSTTPGAHGTTLVNPDGTVNYTPEPGFTGTDTFTYTAVDSSGQTITRTVTVTVGPHGEPDVATTATGTPVKIGVLTNDSGTGLTVKSVTKPAHGTATVNPDGTVTYMPAPGFSGIDTFTYSGVDAAGQTYTQTVTVTVSPKASPDSSTTDPRTPVTITVLDNDKGTALTVTAVTQPTHGKVTINPDGTVTYTPDACPSASNKCFAGVVTFTYTAVDANGTTITQTVTVEVTPLGKDDNVTVRPGGTVVISPLDNDDTGQSMTVTSVTKPAHGTATLRPDGTVAYTPHAGFSGTDTFTYVACDTEGKCVTQTVTVHVKGDAVVPPTTTTTTTTTPPTTAPPAPTTTTTSTTSTSTTTTSGPPVALASTNVTTPPTVPAPHPPVLSLTGASIGAAVAIAMAMLTAGAALVLLARRRRRS